jgi:hypothetical protein
VALLHSTIVGRDASHKEEIKIETVLGICTISRLCPFLFHCGLDASTGSRRQKRDDALLEKEKALDDLKILKGLLPICASCKQIRDDKGHWTQLENYIHEHSEAEFSHGLCPECARKLYPDLYTHEPDNTKG